MELSKNWRAISDDLQVTLEQRHVASKGKNAGKEIWTAYGYYSTAKAALQAWVELEIRRTGLEDIIAVMKRIDELERIIKEKVK